MTKSMTATELKATILAVLDEVAAGEEIEVTKRGHPVARIVPIRGAASLRGTYAGVAASAAEEEDLFTTGVHWDAG